MVNTAHFNTYAQELQSLAAQVLIGLHFNLTEGSFLSNTQRQFSLHSLLIKTHTHCIASSLIEQEFIAQLESFINIMGRVPDFIDGHQHVHQFPIIRTVLLKLYAQRFKANNVAIRSTYPMISLPSFRFKGVVLAYTGGRALTKVLNQLAIDHNPCFAGIYDFSPVTDYRALVQQWLRLAPDNTLIMCHPGQGVDEADVIAQARIKEMAYFSSEQFLEDCGLYKVSLK